MRRIAFAAWKCMLPDYSLAREGCAKCGALEWRCRAGIAQMRNCKFVLDRRLWGIEWNDCLCSASNVKKKIECAECCQAVDQRGSVSICCKVAGLGVWSWGGWIPVSDVHHPYHASSTRVKQESANGSCYTSFAIQTRLWDLYLIDA
jgi:hypothetical protein